MYIFMIIIMELIFDKIGLNKVLTLDDWYNDVRLSVWGEVVGGTCGNEWQVDKTEHINSVRRKLISIHAAL